MNNPNAEHRDCCSHKVVAVGFHTLYYGAKRAGGMPPLHESFTSLSIISLSIYREQD
ncbi:ABC transporter ATP-binding protein [Treponema medium]|nr:ABC transporter ATP-binding protein [Treponema medium]